MLGYAVTVKYLFSDYATIVAASVVVLALASTIFRIMWEIR
jgi:hypothetical protein